jgi:hypothetical protein
VGIKLAWGIIVHFRGPLVCRTVQISYKYVHVPVLPFSLRCFRAPLIPNSLLKPKDLPLLRALLDQSADLALNRLVVQAC